MLLCNMQDFCNQQAMAIGEGNVPLAVAALLASYGPDQGAYTRMAGELSTYMDASWGDHSDPPPQGPAPANPAAAFGEKILARSACKVELAVELGAGLGRSLAELARGAEYVVGIDHNLGFLRCARRLLAGEPVPFLRRMSGWHFEAATAAAGDLATPTALLVCGDALSPPLDDHAFGRVVAANLVDNVNSPTSLFTVMDDLCATGGEVILTSPLYWSNAATADDQRLGGSDPGQEITARWRGGVNLSTPYAIDDQCDIDWGLRYDTRTAFKYRSYYLRARKPPP